MSNVEANLTIKIGKDGKNEVITYQRDKAKVNPKYGLPLNLMNQLLNTLDTSEERIFTGLHSSTEDKNFDQGDDIVFNFLFKAVNKIVLEQKNSEQEISSLDDNEVKLLKFFLGPPFNGLMSLSIDKNIFECWTDFSPSVFTKINSNRRIIVHKDEEKKFDLASLAFDYRFVATGPRNKVSELARFFTGTDHAVKEMIKIITKDIPNDRSNYYWQELDHFLAFEVQVASVDRLNESKIKAKKFRGGDLLKDRKKLKETNYIVYVARDDKGNVKYIGEGEAGREKHINSGVSSCYKANEYHFSGRETGVKIYSNMLTKGEAKAIEFLLLQRYAKQGLWNIKDYET
jgi:hypothetical protein